MPVAKLSATRQLNRLGPARSTVVSSAKEVAKPAVGLLQLLQPRPRHLAVKVDMGSNGTILLPSHVSSTSSIPGNLLGGHATVHESPI
jgi:hypothetical protein